MPPIAINKKLSDSLRWVPAFGREFNIPAACLDCKVLTAQDSAQAAGLEVAASSFGDRYLPTNQQYKAKKELEIRARSAVDGSCRFVLEQAGCWRAEEIEE
jgi:hypothetical protein